MAALRDMGVSVGVAGNQTSRAGEILRQLDLPADLIVTSEDCRASKPDQSFFRALISAAPCEAGRIVYVGDRLDNDLQPANAAGMRTAFIRRGPWGYIWEHHPDMAAAADWRMTVASERRAASRTEGTRSAPRLTCAATTSCNCAEGTAQYMCRCAVVTEM